jgi:hypothetical protein
MEYIFDPILYMKVYYYSLMFFVLITIMYYLNNDFTEKSRADFSKIVGYPFLFIFTFLLSFKPIRHIPGDIWGYIKRFEDLKNQFYFDWNQSEALFSYFSFVSSKIMIAEFYFAIMGAIYVLCVYFACLSWFKKDWFFPFLMLVCSFEFINYANNGIRNGLGTSIFLLGMSRKNIYWKFIIFYIAMGVHKSLFLPTFAYILTFFNNNTKYYIAFWFITIPLSLTNGAFFEAQLQIYYPDEKMGEYFQGYYDEIFSDVGFRWDFVIYSFIGIFLGWFYIYYLKFKDIIYSKIYNTYLFVNGTWILIIGVSYTNRFAYLSWFFLGLVISYPLVKQEKLIYKQNHFFITVLIIFAGFCFFKNKNLL